MRRASILPSTAAVIVSLSLTAAAAEVFDSPGPGYRQQAEQLAPTKKSADVILNVPRVGINRNVDLPTLGDSFSTPIRLDVSGGVREAKPVSEKKDTLQR